MPKDSIELVPSALGSEKANLTADQLQKFTEANAGEDVRTDVEGTLETTEERELSPEQVDKIIATLKTRFEASDNEKLRNMIDFADVEKALRASPEDLYALNKLEGGEPEVVGMNRIEFIFEDRSVESPEGRRNLNFDEADVQRKSFGSNVEFQDEDSYRAMQEIGKFDMNTWSWLKTSTVVRGCGGALAGIRRDIGVSVREYHVDVRNSDFGWRAVLRVKKA